MGTFREYCNNEGFKQYVKGMFNQQYAALPPEIKNQYDLLQPDARQEIEELRAAQQIPLLQAFQQWSERRGVRNQMKQYQSMVPPERKAHGVRPSQYNFGQYSDRGQSYRP